MIKKMKTTKVHLRITTFIRQNRIYLLSCIYFLLVQVQAKGQDQTKPNIILIVSDDHGIDALGCYGNPVIKTPTLDALAKDGTRFTNAFCTSASCSPSRSVILTGMYSHQNGMYGLEHTYHHFSSFDNVKSLSVILSENYYRTARVGKFHLAPEKVYKFEKVFSSGTANQPDSVSLGRSPVEMAEHCQGFINEKSEMPFFLYYATDDPHRSNIYLPDGEISFDTYPSLMFLEIKRQAFPVCAKSFIMRRRLLCPLFFLTQKNAGRRWANITSRFPG